MSKLVGPMSLVWLLMLVLQAIAAGLQDTATLTTTTITTPPPQPPRSKTEIVAAAAAVANHQQHIFARQQSAGSSCSDEGQWNCMTTSWQRCAAGRWSVVMPCAKGTTCSPAGLASDFHVQHDGSVDGDGGTPTTSVASSRGAAAARLWVTSRVVGTFGVLLCWLLG